jgi:hypothetical protein
MANLQTTVITGFLNLCQASPSPTAGRLWYDTDGGILTLSACGFCGGTWSVGGNMINGRIYNVSGGASQNSALTVSGASTCNCRNSEEYNGTSWASGGNTIQSICQRGGLGCSQNAAIVMGGVTGNPTVPYESARNNTEEYNGTSWSNAGNLIFVRIMPGFAGTQNSGLAFGGAAIYYAGPPYAPFAYTQGCSEEYNGTSWATNTAPIRRNILYPGGGGVQNAALKFGDTASPTQCFAGYVEEYNGTTWADHSFLVTQQGENTQGMGTTSQMAVAGGNSGTKMMIWEGIGWAQGAYGLFPSNINSGYSGAGGSSTSFIANGGSPGPSLATYEYTSGFVGRNRVF